MKSLLFDISHLHGLKAYFSPYDTDNSTTVLTKDLYYQINIKYAALIWEMRAQISFAGNLFLDRAGLKRECYFNLVASFGSTYVDVAFLSSKGSRLGINSAYYSCSTFSYSLRHPYHYLVTRLLDLKDSLPII